MNDTETDLIHKMLELIQSRVNSLEELVQE